MAEFQPYPADHYLGVFLAQASEDEAAGYIAGRTYHVSGAPGCNSHTANWQTSKSD